VILSKFWSRYDLQNFRKRNVLGDDQGELSKSTVLLLVYRAVPDVRVLCPGIFTEFTVTLTRITKVLFYSKKHSSFGYQCFTSLGKFFENLIMKFPIRDFYSRFGPNHLIRMQHLAVPSGLILVRPCYMPKMFLYL
jgi:hypothetical protein